MGGEGTKEANLPQKNHWLLWHFSALPPSVAKRRSSPDQILMLKLIHGMDTMDIVDTTDHTDTDTGMEKDLLMLNQLPMLHQLLMLMPVPMLMLGMDTMATTLMLIMDTTDRTDTGDTMARGLLMLNQLRLQNLDQMLMPVLTHGMDTMDIMDTTDLMDTDTGMERDLLMLSLLPLLMLMLGMDTMATDLMDTTDHMDTDTGTERDLPMLSQLLMLMLGMDTTAIIHMLIMVTTDHTDIGDTGERSKHKLTDNETIFLQKINFLGST